MSQDRKDLRKEQEAHTETKLRLLQLRSEIGNRPTQEQVDKLRAERDSRYTKAQVAEMVKAARAEVKPEAAIKERQVRNKADVAKIAELQATIDKMEREK